MGYEIQTIVLVAPRKGQLDWSAWLAAARDIRLERLWDTGELFPWEAWLEYYGDWDDVPFPSSLGGLVALRRAQSAMPEIATFCEAIESDGGWGLPGIKLPHHRVWVTGDVTDGEDEGSDWIFPLLVLNESGAAAKVGFTHWTAYEEKPISKRRFGFAADELRAVRAGVALGHVAEGAGRLTHPDGFASKQEWSRLWLATLGDDPEKFDGPRLARFAARGLTMAAWLRGSEDLDTTAAKVAAVLDNGDLGEIKRVRSHAALWKRLRKAISKLDKCARDAEDDSGATPGNYLAHLDPDLSEEIMTGPLALAIAGLADLHRDAVYELAVPDPGETPTPPPPDRIGWSSRQPVLLAIDSSFSWENVTATVEAQPAEQQTELGLDIRELRYMFDDGYRRSATTEDFDDVCLLIAARGYETAKSIERLGACGALDAGGALWWGIE